MKKVCINCKYLKLYPSGKVFTNGKFSVNQDGNTYLNDVVMTCEDFEAKGVCK